MRAECRMLIVYVREYIVVSERLSLLDWLNFCGMRRETFFQQCWLCISSLIARSKFQEAVVADNDKHSLMFVQLVKNSAVLASLFLTSLCYPKTALPFIMSILLLLRAFNNVADAYVSLTYLEVLIRSHDFITRSSSFKDQQSLDMCSKKRCKKTIMNCTFYWWYATKFVQRQQVRKSRTEDFYLCILKSFSPNNHAN